MFGLIRVKRIRGLLEQNVEMLERIHRLEIAHKQLVEAQELLQGQHNSLRAKVVGSMGGRPPKNVTPLSEIPLGDKAALRRAMGLVPSIPPSAAGET